MRQRDRIPARRACREGAAGKITDLLAAIRGQGKPQGNDGLAGECIRSLLGRDEQSDAEYARQMAGAILIYEGLQELKGLRKDLRAWMKAQSKPGKGK